MSKRPRAVEVGVGIGVGAAAVVDGPGLRAVVVDADAAVQGVVGVRRLSRVVPPEFFSTALINRLRSS